MAGEPQIGIKAQQPEADNYAVISREHVQAVVMTPRTDKTEYNKAVLSQLEKEATARSDLSHVFDEIAQEYQQEVAAASMPGTYLLGKLAARDRLKEAQEMGLTEAEIQRREELRAMVIKLGYHDAPEVFERVRQALNAWEVSHPTDPRLPHFAKLLSAAERGAKLAREPR